jgi:hypothetical protein
MDKHETVIDSIQKLISLGVSDQEIADNLSDVGIGKQEALSLIQQAKSKKNGSSEASEEPSKVSFAASFKESESEAMDDQIVKQIPLAKKSVPQPQIQPKAEEKKAPVKEDIAEKIMADVASGEDDGEDIEDSVNKELSSVGKKNDLDSVDDDILELQKAAEVKINQAQAKPVSQPPQPQPQAKPQPQIQAKSPFSIPSVDFSVNEKTYSKTIPSDASPDFEELWKKGIVVAVNAKLAEMKRLKENVDSDVQQKVDEAVRKELYQFKILQDSQKELMISSNKEALEQKQKEIVFIIDTKIAELKQYNKQLSDTLANLESAKMQQAYVLQQINQTLEEAKKTKAQLVVEMNAEMIKSKSQAQAFIDNSTAHLNQMDERINKTLELEKNIAEGMLTQAEQKIEQLAIQRADELIANMEVELNRLQSISKKISPEMLDQKIQVLDEFKKQFLTSMQQNLAQINAAIDELNQKNIIAEKTLQEKSLAIDAKLEELTKFEKEFTEKFMKKSK